MLSMAIHSYKELLAASDENLIADHDQIAKTTGANVNYYLNELSRRHTNRLTQTMLDLTGRTERLSKAMQKLTATNKRLTHIILWLTAINTAFVICSAFR